jgi:hypothetical protein
MVIIRQKLYYFNPEDGGQFGPLKRWYSTVTLYGTITQKTKNSIFTGVGTSNLAKFSLVSTERVSQRIMSSKLSRNLL